MQVFFISTIVFVILVFTPNDRVGSLKVLKETFITKETLLNMWSQTSSYCINCHGYSKLRF